MENIIFTCGDTNGIGPEISLRSLNKLYLKNKYRFILPIPLNVFNYYTDRIKLQFPYKVVKKFNKTDNEQNKVIIVDIGKAKLDIGKPTRYSGRAGYKSIIEAHKLIKSNISSAMITAPISKIAWQKAGIDFPGHTELLAHLGESKNFSMMFLSQKFKCALATIHEPIMRVPKLITKAKLSSLFELVHDSLSIDLKIIDPKIAVLGLNPHSGENGKIGLEEISEIIPAINGSVKKGISVKGPFVPDAFFANKLFLNYDAVIGMYHDQLLIPFKMQNFNKGVNFTAGLPFIRTSPDHGTAYDIAGTFSADITSMIESFNWGRKILSNRKKVLNA